MDSLVGRLYEEAKRGRWDLVLQRIEADSALGARAAAYVRPASGWTFLHQAAFWGHDNACRVLLAAGASAAVVCRAGTRPDQAARRRKHDDLATWLCGLADEAPRTQRAHDGRRATTATTNLGAIVRSACSDGMNRLRRLSKSTHASAASTRAPIDDTPGTIVACSGRYAEAIEMCAATRMDVVYGGGVVHVPQGARYYVDTTGGVLVGWHGTFDPPLGMDGLPLV
ncbi:Ankyrin repeat protein [Pandoravirus kuranda]|uniref:Ankyrin repeat protein n=1 Tax=Pandoravirus kuranda TaxID=3019033 RepID=A0AA95EEG1_9VIRU|nr:Ankyrin repeat protein [Pandoravirus kuranda]